MTREDLEREVQLAQIYLRTAETYLAWAQMGLKLSEDFDVIFGQGDQLSLVESKYTSESGPPSTVSVLPTVAARDESARPSLRRAILMVMTTDPDATWKKSDIFGALKRRGWEPKGGKPSAQLATRLSEMVERDEIERVSVGHYRLVSADEFRAPEARDERPQEGGDTREEGR